MRVFEILDAINQNDTENKTRNLLLSPHFVRAKKTGQGAEITMGVDDETLHKLMDPSSGFSPFLVVVNMLEYQRIKKGEKI